MNITEIYKQFPTQEACITHLEKVRWAGEPTCPYCFETQAAKEKSQNRYHCNACNRSFSVTVNTIFHDTKLPLQKWFLAIMLMLNAKKGISAKQLERDLDVTYKTAWYMAMRIRRAMLDDGEMLRGIIEIDETYVGGKPRKSNKREDDKPNKRGRGTKKTPVVGMIERGEYNKVYAQVQKDLTSKSLTELVRQRVKTEFSVIITDEYSGYAKLNELLMHLSNSHSLQFVNGVLHTNTIESFWAILKRGIIGQFHKVSEKYLPLYLAEFCFRFNNRKNIGIFELTVVRAVAV